MRGIHGKNLIVCSRCSALGPTREAAGVFPPQEVVDREVVSRRMEYRKDYGTLLKTVALACYRPSDSQTHGLRVQGGFGWEPPGKGLGSRTGSMGDRQGRRLPRAFGRGDLTASLIGGAGLPGLEASMPRAVPTAGQSLLRASRARHGWRDDTPLLRKGDQDSSEMTETGYKLTGRFLRPLWAGAVADLHVVVCALGDEPCIAFVRTGSEGLTVATRSQRRA